MAAPLLLLQDIELTFGSTKLLDAAQLAVAPGERLCLVGRNGSGKSTLLKIAAGMVEADKGTRFAQPGATIRYLPQEPDLSGFETVRAYVEAGLAPGDDAHRALHLLRCLGLGGEENPSHLSGGEARRAALARVLAPMPDILLLDEPTNHLDLPAIEWLEEELRRMRGALVLISHDRRFLQNLSRATLWLDRGRTRRLEQGFAAYEEWRDRLLEEEEAERHKLDRRIAMEQDWVRYGVSGRRKRNQGRLARLGAMRRQVREQLHVAGAVKMQVSEGVASGSRVIEAHKISKSFDGRVIVRDFSVRIMRANRIAIVGPNGAGKTTLVNLLTGRLQPDQGSVKLGDNLAMAALDQSRLLLDPDSILSDVLTGGLGDTVLVGGKPVHVVSYMKDFLFTPEQARTPVHVLSGGERARLLLARLLTTPSNFLVLDEPTNDLDLETLDLLEEMIADYPGTVLVVSHDRDFLDRVASSILMSEGEGRFVEYAGGYSDMLAQRGGGVAAKALTTGKPKTQGVEKSRAPSRAKMNFSDSHMLKNLPARIAQIEEEIGGLQKKLEASDFYGRDPKGFAAASARLGELHGELAQAEERWLALEIRRVEIEGA